MPRGTTLRNFRADDALWQRAKVVAEMRGESLSDVLRRALEEYAESTRRQTMMTTADIDGMIKHAGPGIRDDLLDIRNGERVGPGVDGE